MEKIILGENCIANSTEVFNNDSLQDDAETQAFDNVIIYFLGIMGGTSIPEYWQIDCFSNDGEYQNSYQYKNKSEYEDDKKYLKAATLKIEKDKEYSYLDLESYAYVTDMSFEPAGKGSIGKGFLSITNDKDQTASFVFTSYNDVRGSFYTCIYNDFKEETK